MRPTSLVSVIIPTYNRTELLKETVQSILCQTYSNLEVFVISDGINEKDREAMTSLKDPRLHYFDQENSGCPSSPRNHGIRKAKGKYIAFCDDDDLWMKDKIEKQVLALEKNSHSGLCYGKMIRFDGKREWTVSHEEGPADFNSLLRVNTIPISAVFMRKALLDQHGGFEESGIVGDSEDYEFLLRYALHTKFLYQDDYLIRYRSGDQRATSTDDNRKISHVFKYFKDILGCFYLIGRRYPRCFFKIVCVMPFHVKNFIKSWGYIWLKALRNSKHS